MILNCLCRNLPRCCSRGSPGGWIRFSQKILGWLIYKWRRYLYFQQLQKSYRSFIKDNMTRGVNIVWRIFEKLKKKFKLKSQDPKKHNFLMFLDKFTLFVFRSLKKALPVLLSFIEFFVALKEWI